MPKLFKLVVFVPTNQADVIRALLGELGAGKIGNYDYASFSVLGTGRFRPLPGANPTVGKIGKVESVSEERIETVVSEDILDEVLDKLRKAHSYEEPVIDVYPLISHPVTIGGDKEGVE